MKTPSIALAALASLLHLGCSPESSAPPSSDQQTCAVDAQVGGVCAGIPSEPLCAERVCTGGMECATVVTVSDDDELQAALSGAKPGTCIALAPATYGAAVLSAGVSLVGRHPNDVKLSRVEAKGPSSLVQGVSILGGGLTASDAPDLHVRAVRFESSGDVGVTILGSSSVTMTQSEIVGSASYGLQALSSGRLEMTNTLVRATNGPGLWIQQADACENGVTLSVTLEDVVVADNKLFGIALIGANATMKNVRVSDNSEAEGFLPGGGISVSGCSVVDAKGIYVRDNSAFGVLVDNSSATLGGPSSDEQLDVSRNLRGLWVQNIGKGDPSQTVGVHNAHLLENSGVGLGINGGSRGVIIYGMEVRDTALQAMPVALGGVEQIGDGLNWLGLSHAQIDGLRVSGSARRSVLIDGPVGSGSLLANVSLEGGDENLGVLQQNLQTGDEQPTLSGATPLTTSTTADYAIPIAPTAPSAVQ